MIRYLFVFRGLKSQPLHVGAAAWVSGAPLLCWKQASWEPDELYRSFTLFYLFCQIFRRTDGKPMTSLKPEETSMVHSLLFIGGIPYVFAFAQ